MNGNNPFLEFPWAEIGIEDVLEWRPSTDKRNRCRAPTNRENWKIFVDNESYSTQKSTDTIHWLNANYDVGETSPSNNS